MTIPAGQPADEPAVTYRKAVNTARDLLYDATQLRDEELWTQAAQLTAEAQVWATLAIALTNRNREMLGAGP